MDPIFFLNKSDTHLSTFVKEVFCIKTDFCENFSDFLREDIFSVFLIVNTQSKVFYQILSNLSVCINTNFGENFCNFIREGIFSVTQSKVFYQILSHVTVWHNTVAWFCSSFNSSVLTFWFPGRSLLLKPQTELNNCFCFLSPHLEFNNKASQIFFFLVFEGRMIILPARKYGRH